MSQPYFGPAAAASQIVVHQGTAPTPEGTATLRVLQQAVAGALDRKRRLGHYAVVWQNGKAVQVAPDDLPLMP